MSQTPAAIMTLGVRVQGRGGRGLGRHLLGGTGVTGLMSVRLVTLDLHHLRACHKYQPGSRPLPDPLHSPTRVDGYYFNVSPFSSGVRIQKLS